MILRMDEGWTCTYRALVSIRGWAGWDGSKPPEAYVSGCVKVGAQSPGGLLGCGADTQTSLLVAEATSGQMSGLYNNAVFTRITVRQGSSTAGTTTSRSTPH